MIYCLGFGPISVGGGERERERDRERELTAMIVTLLDLTSDRISA